MRGINRRLFVFGLAVLAAGALVAPPRLLAQQAQEDAGTPADAITAASVKNFINDLVAKINHGDPSAVAMVDSAMYPNFFLVDKGHGDAAGTVLKSGKISPIKIWAVRNVRQHSSGHLSAEVTYNGWLGAYYATERWVVQPSTAGGYTVVGDEPATLYIAPGLKPGKMTMTLSSQGLKATENSFPAGTNLLVVSTRNTDSQQLTTIVFRLGPGKTLAEAATQPRACYGLHSTARTGTTCFHISMIKAIK